MGNLVINTNKATDRIKRDLLRFRAYMEPSEPTTYHHLMIPVVDTISNLFNNISCTFLYQDAENCKSLATVYPGIKIATLLIHRTELPNHLVGHDPSADYVIVGPTFFVIQDYNRIDNQFEELREGTQMMIQNLEDCVLINSLNLEDPDWWWNEGWELAIDE